MSQSLPPDPIPSKRARGSALIVALIILATVVVSLQYTSFALLPAAQTSTLWGILTGLVIGGAIFWWRPFNRG